jgi:hypothetical protein
MSDENCFKVRVLMLPSTLLVIMKLLGLYWRWNHHGMFTDSTSGTPQNS